MPRASLRSLARRVRRPRRPVSLTAASGRAQGRALLSYLADPAAWDEGDPRLNGHSNKWESREYARTLSGLGFDVDVVDFDDAEFSPGAGYDVVIAIHSELSRLVEESGVDLALMHHTGAYPPFQNAAELRRIEELRERRGVRCVPRRVVEVGEEYERSLSLAKASSLLGNEWTLSTYPERYRSKVGRMPVSGSALMRVKETSELLPDEREFLWFFGSGAVHKGLDLTLEVFARRPELVLHVVGNVAGEEDFIDAYRRELFELPNVHFHGFLTPESAEFRSLASRCFCVVAPTCSEGTSPATVTMLQLGLYPLVSRECGITLPEGAGPYLEHCSVEEIEARAAELHGADPGELLDQIRSVQRLALKRYSRDAFQASLHAYLADIIP